MPHRTAVYAVEGKGGVSQYSPPRIKYTSGDSSGEGLRASGKRNEHDDKATKEMSHWRVRIEWWAVQYAPV